MREIIREIMNNKLILCFGIVVILDIFLGSIRAIKEKKWNSTVGINGALRKVAMVGSVMFLLIADKVLNINFLGFIPKEMQSFFPSIGLAGVFGILFILYECTSILKNMVLIGLPIPQKLRKKIEELLDSFSNELENKEVK